MLVPFIKHLPKTPAYPQPMNENLSDQEKAELDN